MVQVLSAIQDLANNSADEAAGTLGPYRIEQTCVWASGVAGCCVEFFWWWRARLSELGLHIGFRV